MGYDSVYLGYNVLFYFMDSVYFEDEPYTGKSGKIAQLRDAVSVMQTSCKQLSESLNLSIDQYQYLLRLLPNQYL